MIIHPDLTCVHRVLNDAQRMHAVRAVYPFIPCPIIGAAPSQDPFAEERVQIKLRRKIDHLQKFADEPEVVLRRDPRRTECDHNVVPFGTIREDRLKELNVFCKEAGSLISFFCLVQQTVNVAAHVLFPCDPAIIW